MLYLQAMPRIQCSTHTHIHGYYSCQTTPVYDQDQQIRGLLACLPASIYFSTTMHYYSQQLLRQEGSHALLLEPSQTLQSLSEQSPWSHNGAGLETPLIPIANRRVKIPEQRPKWKAHI